MGRKELADLWDARQQEFQQSYDQQVFLRDAEQIASWTATQESALAMEGVGDSLDIVVELLKKHDDFEKSLVAQQEKTKALDETANRLLAYNHFDADGIRARRDDVLAKRTHLDELAKEHRRKLEDSHKFQQFKQDADEAEAWIIEKLQTVRFRERAMSDLHPYFPLTSLGPWGVFFLLVSTGNGRIIQ